MKISCTVLLFALICTGVGWSQKHALGFMAGRSAYVGDIGSKYFFLPQNQKNAIGIIYKWQMSPRFHFRSSFGLLKVPISAVSSNNLVRKSYEISFSKDIFELGAGVDFNLFPYDFTKEGKFQGTPYFILELVGIQYQRAISMAPSASNTEELSTNTETARNLVLPFGVGYKVQILDRFSLALEAKVRYMLKDDLDDGNFINVNLIKPSKRKYKSQFNEPYVNDFYTFFGFTFVYTFGSCGCYE